ncbi:type VII secretion protein EccE [Nocardia altamirensis]|uniref:type VII secretion protein EccE n=1 Tax=Nocardia altamirensis TaxID=472158 RepID=UPI0008402546|nr:type VII secretion protein EccE [Nocardia altamirensis]
MTTTHSVMTTTATAARAVARKGRAYRHATTRRWERTTLALPAHTGDLVVLALGLSLVGTVAVTVRLWWIPVVVMAVMVLAAIVRFDGYPVWRIGLAVAGFRRRRRRSAEAAPAPAPVDVEVSGVGIGVRWDRSGLVSMIEISPAEPLTPTWVDPAGQARLEGGTALDLAMLARLLRFGDAVVGIDVVAAGHPLPRGTGHYSSYRRALEGLPLVADRTTWLIVRLDPLANLAALRARGSARRTLAAATLRITARLCQSGVPAAALSARELATLEHFLAPRRCQERWGHLRAAGDLVLTTFVADPHQLQADSVDRWWSVTSAVHIATTVRLSETSAGQRRVGALARYVTTRPLRQPPVPGLLNVPGHQGEALASAMPATTVTEVRAPSVPLDSVELTRIPLGPSGQLIGFTDDGHALALPLVTPASNAAVTVIQARAGRALAVQLVLRAVATGARVVIHTEDPDRWRALVADSHQRAWLATEDAGRRSPQIAVFDRRDRPAADRTSTALVLCEADAEPVPEAAVQIVQPDPDPDSDRFELTVAGHSYGLHLRVAAGEHLYLYGASAGDPGPTTADGPDLRENPTSDVEASDPGPETASADARTPDAPVVEDGAPATPPWLMPVLGERRALRQIPRETLARPGDGGGVDARRPHPSSSFDLDRARRDAADRVRREQDDTERDRGDTGTSQDGPPGESQQDPETGAPGRGI